MTNVHALATLVTDEAARPVATIVNVDPDTALRWLEHNLVNRKIRTSIVDRYARDMKSGKWLLSGEAIKFSDTGELLDGQHRLLGVIRANLTVAFFVVNNLSADTQQVLDTGAKRTAADTLGFAGYHNRHALASVARLVKAYLDGELKTAGQASIPTYSNSELIAVIDQNPDIVDAVSWVNGSLKARIPANPATLGFVLWLLRRIDTEQADTFFHDLAQMKTSGSGDPRATLLRRLSAAKQDRQRMSNVTQAHYFIRAWNSVREGKTLGNLKHANAFGPFEFARPT